MATFTNQIQGLDDPMTRFPTPPARRHPNRPIVAVGAVILDGDRVLLVKRGDETFFAAVEFG